MGMVGQGKADIIRWVRHFWGPFGSHTPLPPVVPLETGKGSVVSVFGVPLLNNCLVCGNQFAPVAGLDWTGLCGYSPRSKFFPFVYGPT